MIVIGHYRWVWAGGSEVSTATKPFYGKRTVWLSSIRATALQVLVPFLDQMIWVNIRESDLVATLK